MFSTFYFYFHQSHILPFYFYFQRVCLDFGEEARTLKNGRKWKKEKILEDEDLKSLFFFINIKLSQNLKINVCGVFRVLEGLHKFFKFNLYCYILLKL